MLDTVGCDRKINSHIDCCRSLYVVSAPIRVTEILDTPVGVYQAGFDYPGRSPFLLVHVSHSLHLTHRYCLSGAFLMFDRFLPLMKAFHFDWLSISHQFSSIMDSSEATRIVSPTRITLDSTLLCENDSLILSVPGSFCKTSCDEI